MAGRRKSGVAMRRRLAMIALSVGSLILIPFSASADAAPGGCAEFGANVAGLATGLGAEFGAIASSVATSGPKAFSTNVVKLEQAELC